MDWFERLTGFAETSPADVRAGLSVHSDRLVSSANGRSFGIGHFELASLAELRERVQLVSPSGTPSLRVVTGDVRELHRDPAYADALFQVASQFNCLEMPTPGVTPEDGVAGYQHDHTQGPACAIAAGAATIFRNYFVPVGSHFGQSADRQLDGLRAVTEALAGRLGLPTASLVSMENGYALCSKSGLEAIGSLLEGLDDAERDTLRSKLAIGLQWDVEVTDEPLGVGHSVSQAFCSALPIGYSHVPWSLWEAFARLVLEATYEATLLAAVLNANRRKSNIIFLTLVGGGVFGNAPRWIFEAIGRAIALVHDIELDVRIVSYGEPSGALVRFVENFGSSAKGE